jgi:hypothetical protein
MAKEEGKSGKLFKRIRDTSKEFIDGIKEEFDETTAPSREKKEEYRSVKAQEIKTRLKSRASDTSTPDKLYYSIESWFWAMIFLVFICIIIFLFSLTYGVTNPKFLLIGLLSLLAIPFVVLWCLIHMIPTIKIFGITIFDRHKLSLRRQLSIGKEIARLFTKEFLEESPIFAFLFFTFLVIFVLSIVVVFIP